VIAAALLAAVALAAPTPKLTGQHPCPGQAGFTCATLTVPLDRTGQALDAQRAVPAERLGQFQLGRGVREPQVRVELPTGQVCLDVDAHVDRGQRQTHKARSPLSSSSIFWIAVLVMHRPVSRQKIRPRTLYGFRGLEVSR